MVVGLSTPMGVSSIAAYDSAAEGRASHTALAHASSRLTAPVTEGIWYRLALGIASQPLAHGIAHETVTPRLMR